MNKSSILVVTKNEHYIIIKHPICIKCKTTVTPNKILSGSRNNPISILYGNIYITMKG